MSIKKKRKVKDKDLLSLLLFEKKRKSDNDKNDESDLKNNKKEV
jgi:hypothetical protein